MKKTLSIFLSALMVAGLAMFTSCSGNNNTVNGDTNDVENEIVEDNNDVADNQENENNENAEDVSTDATSDLAYVTNKGTLVVGITEYEPMNYQVDGKWTGFDTEFAEAVAAKLGVKVEFIEIDWDSKAFELESKAIDCVWNGMTLTDEVLNSMNCTNPYVVNAQVLVMNKEFINDYTTTESLDELTLAAEAGSAGAAALNDLGYEPVEVGTQADALMEVAAGAEDGCVIDITMANAMTGEGTSYADLAYGLALSSEEYGIGFRKNSDLTAKVNEIMAELVADGTLPALAEKYDLTLAVAE